MIGFVKKPNIYIRKKYYMIMSRGGVSLNLVLAFILFLLALLIGVLIFNAAAESQENLANISDSASDESFIDRFLSVQDVLVTSFLNEDDKRKFYET